MNIRDDVLTAVKKVGSAISNLGSPEYGPSDRVVSRAESIIGRCIPSDYLAFLKQFGSGEFFGDELFGFYENPNDDTPRGDLVYQYKWYRKREITTGNQVPFLSTDLGEVFVFEEKLSYPTRSVVCPVYKITGDQSTTYSGSFIEFIYKYSELSRG